MSDLTENAAGIAGPLSFIAAWAAGSAIAENYSPVSDAISRLAAQGAPTRPLMTAGFLAFAGGVGLNAKALRSAGLGRAWVAALAAAGTTVGVAAFPLDAGVDGVHGAFATAGYVALVAIPVLAARPLAAQGHRRAAVASVALAGFAAGCLALTALDSDTNGLFQRLGLTAIDAWLIAQGARQLATRRGRATRRSDGGR